MTENLRYMNSIVQNDRKLFAEYNAKIERLGVLKGSLEKDAVRKEKIKASIEVKKQEIEEEKEKKAAYLLKVREDKKSYQSSLRELQANARRLQAMVERLEAKSRKSYSKKAENKSTSGADHSLPLIPDKGFGSQKGRLAIPVKGEVVGSFGRHKHPEFNSYTVSNGISIAAPAGADIRSVYDGQVIFANYFKGYGNMVIVDHGGGFFSLYGHAAKIVKRVGATVARNDVVASVGDVDSARGPMLYFEIRYQGKPVDPAPWFR
jgi:septal ring factor EnvC (AmiA/AmiB activator)